MAVTINFRLRDSESDASLDPIPVTFADGQTLAEMQVWVNNAIPIIEAAIGGYVEATDAVIDLDPTIASGGGPVNAGVYNERGAVFLFDTTGPRRESVRLPQILHTLMTGKEVVTTQPEVSAFTDLFITGVSNGGGVVAPITPNGYAWSSVVRGRRSFRK